MQEAIGRKVPGLEVRIGFGSPITFPQLFTDRVMDLAYSAAHDVSRRLADELVEKFIPLSISGVGRSKPDFGVTAYGQLERSMEIIDHGYTVGEPIRVIVRPQSKPGPTVGVVSISGRPTSTGRIRRGGSLVPVNLQNPYVYASVFERGMMSGLGVYTVTSKSTGRPISIPRISREGIARIKHWLAIRGKKLDDREFRALVLRIASRGPTTWKNPWLSVAIKLLREAGIIKSTWESVRRVTNEKISNIIASSRK